MGEALQFTKHCQKSITAEGDFTPANYSRGGFYNSQPEEWEVLDQPITGQGDFPTAIKRTG